MLRAQTLLLFLASCATVTSVACTISRSTGPDRPGAPAPENPQDGSNQPGASNPALNKRVRAIEAGPGHTCALRESGAIACWGSNSHGQLGTGDYQDHAGVVATLAIDDAVEIAMGRAHTCVRLETGSVMCWGDNDRGALGNGSGGPRRKSGTPVAVRGLKDAVELISGDDHLCARRRGGAVVCWGDNAHGQLASAGRKWWPAPVAVAGLSDASAIAAGSAHTCALRSGSGVICWGDNRRGQLGDGGKRSHARPSGVKGIDRVEALRAAGDRSCAVHAEGRVSCWGADASGVDLTRPRAVAGLQPIKTLSLGPAHTCAIDAGGGLRCWGTNRDGRLGDGTSSSRVRPTRVGGLDPVTDVALGRRHTCALTRAGDVLCWGDEEGGLLGAGATSPKRRGPTTWARGIADATRLSVGSLHSCVVTSAGEARCWGDNTSGQLGDRSRLQRETPSAVRGLTRGVDIAAGWGHTCAVTTDGGVHCWGDNAKGQVNARATPGRVFNIPTRVPGISALKGSISGVASGAAAAHIVTAGEAHSCVIVSGGRVRCWGSDEKGQLGDGPGKGDGRVIGLADAVQLSAGARHTCARRRGGQVLCWGDNLRGQIGDGAGAAQLKTPVESPRAVLKLNDVAEVEAGEAHTCARQRSGKVLCWGHNDRAQLGSGTASNIWTTRVPTQGVTQASALGSGLTHVCAASGNGAGASIVCWGSGERGQLGGTNKQDAATARPGPKLSARSISGGRDHTCALLHSGEIACWGSNESGQLGDAAQAFATRPQAVKGL